MAVAEPVQRALRTLADDTRLRLLAALELGEFAVQELTDALGVPQSRVSRHLSILREAGFAADRRDGSFVFYRLATPPDGPIADTWRVARSALSRDPQVARDRAALDRAIAARAARNRSFFDSVGPEWDGLRKVLNDDLLRARSLAHLLPDGLRVADIGTGTGVLARELADRGVHVIAVDHSDRMLAAAQAKLTPEQAERVELRHGEASALPLEDDEVDACFAHMVLHYLPRPGDALAEMVRVTSPGGSVVAVDFVDHEKEWMREELGVLWLGFAPSVLEELFASAGLAEVRIEVQEASAQGTDLPATLIASGVVPGGRP